MSLNVLLISTYEMGRQPFGLASPAAWLSRAGASVRCLDLSVEPFSPNDVHEADLVAFYVPMHMATRMAVAALERVWQSHPGVKTCFYGLYASTNEDYLRELGVDFILGGEFEAGLVSLVRRLSRAQAAERPLLEQLEPLVSFDRQQFVVPERKALPDLNKYARLIVGNKQHHTTGYVEASRGCKHLCRHCPIVPVYQGRFRIVQRDVVLADIRQQVAAGAQHITFGDPDFFNGPSHAISLVTSLHEEFPHVTYDVTIKVEHLLKHAKHLETLKRTGCLFITSAAESFDEKILAIFQKNHSKEELATAMELCRDLDLVLVPTFVAFTPWTTLAGYRSFLTEIARMELVEQVAPIQYTIRLLIPPGSYLLDLPEVQGLVTELDRANFNYKWRNPDPRVEALQQDLERLVQVHDAPRQDIFLKIWERAWRDERDRAKRPPLPKFPLRAGTIPHLTEPWYC